jgi:NAD(P)-dependent dehydrogenase (short-subunit alcohol dehydrogenase family)
MITPIAIMAGAGAGLGQATALALHEAGLTVVAVDVELRQHGIRVNAAVPQLIATAKNKAILPPEMLAAAVKRSPSPTSSLSLSATPRSRSAET